MKECAHSGGVRECRENSSPPQSRSRRPGTAPVCAAGRYGRKKKRKASAKQQGRGAEMAMRRAAFLAVTLAALVVGFPEELEPGARG